MTRYLKKLKRKFNMGEQKNLFLAIGLSVAIIVIFQFLFPQQTAITPTESNKVEELQTTTSVDNEVDINQIIKTKEEIIAVDDRILINTPSLRGSINLKGAKLDDLVLLNYYKTLDKKTNITLFYPDGTTNPYFVEFEWKSNKINTELPGIDTQWQSNSSELTPEKPVTLYWVNNDNITFKINFKVDENYMFSVSQEIENNSNKSLNIFARRTIKRIHIPDTINFFILHEGLVSNINESLYEKKYKKLQKECSDNNVKIVDGKKVIIKEPYCRQSSLDAWLGFTDKYWMSALIPIKSEKFEVDFKHYNLGRDIFVVRYLEEESTIINPNTNHIFSGEIFAGAKSLKILKQYQKDYNITRFDDAIDWGWFSFLTKPIFIAINWFYDLVGNFGIAIISFTILMRLILFPLAHTSFKSMAKMKKLQPEMQRLKETYPDDRQKMQQELMALYKKEGANPVAGCLPMIVQIPIFFSLYKVLFVTIEMYHAPFYGWIHDLSAPDPLGLMTLFGLVRWDFPQFLSIINIGILPIFMGFTMWLQQKLNPAPTDPTQAKIFAFLPFVFTFILAGFAAGLVLYWSVNNVLSIAQQWFIQKKILAKKDG